MPKATCPACKSELKYPKDAEVGSTVTCPDCDEVFIPPKLMKKEPTKKKYNPEDDEDTYKVGRTSTKAEDRDKSEAFETAARAARRREAESRPPKRPAWYEGPEVWLLIFAVGAGGGLPFGFWLARNWEKMSDAKVFWIFVVLIAIGMAAVGLGGSAWAWLRRNK